MKFYTIISAAILLTGSAVAAPDVDTFKKTRAANLAHPQGNLAHGVTSSTEASDDNATNASIISRDVGYPGSGATITGSFITQISGQFYAPKTLSSGSGSLWLGIDGDRCDAAFQGGIGWESDGTTNTYYPWYQWLPHNQEVIPFIMDSNHLMRVTVTAITKTTGRIFVENLTTHKTVTVDLGGEGQIQNPPLCFGTAQWMVGATRQDAGWLKRAHLDTIAITGASVIQNGVPIGIDHAQVRSDKHSEIVLRFSDTILIRQK